MIMVQQKVVILFLLTSVRPSTAPGLDVIPGIFELGQDITFGILKTWKAVEEMDGNITGPRIFNKKQDYVLGYIIETNVMLQHIEQQLSSNWATVHNTLLHDLPKQLQRELQWTELDNCMTDITNANTLMQSYIQLGYKNDSQQWILERHTLEDFAENVVSHSKESVRYLISHLHDLIVKPRLVHGSRLLSSLTQAYQETETLACDLQQSPQQMLYNLYNSIALVELKGYTMMQFSWMLLRLYNRGNFTLEAEMMRNTFEERTRQKLEVVQSAMKAASRQMWRCDPRVHIEGETYVQLTKLLQGHVQNEVDMNQENTCRENCQYYSYAQSTGCFNDEMCQVMQRCNGRLLDCQYFDSDMWICKANGDTGRRYEWIEYENGKTLGRRGSCPNRKFKVDSWWRWLFWHCSYCFCLCDEQGPESDRYFNLRPVLADTANNKVVTGLRFAKVNRVIHLQIQEGSLLPQGAINASTLQWRPVDDYRITDADVQNERDYHTLSWEQRAIDLDDLEARAGHVLTGVRFRNVGTHLNPEIMVTPLNFTAGTLIKPQEKSMWLSNDNTDASYVKPRIQLKLTAPDVPTNSHVGSIPDSRNDQFMLFTHSDISTDAAQTTVPFVDAQPVTSDPPTILAGAGIYHKGNLYYGGFIAPKIITYDMSSHLVAQFPSSP